MYTLSRWSTRFSGPVAKVGKALCDCINKVCTRRKAGGFLHTSELSRHPQCAGEKEEGESGEQGGHLGWVDQAQEGGRISYASMFRILTSFLGLIYQHGSTRTCASDIAGLAQVQVEPQWLLGLPRRKGTNAPLP